ncbi:alpha/beta fold hydrolase [Phenylobacterium sp.]|uniref:alpha/beta fold hydrolase n=1 Tax=Phenylobacterium sp. TaxID=1871053 RepID=UPI00374D4E78
MTIRRRFLQMGARRVHYLRAGSGPPAVLIHSSPANAWFLRPEIERLSADYTVFAFDTPGFGLSEPLPLTTMIVADLADALAQTLAAIDMPPCPIFGSHSGAAIALEFGVRHPERVTGLVLDGVPAFTTEECDALFSDYFRPLPVTDLGGHYAEIWTRFRDQSVWFPWSQREPQNLNAYDLGAPESTHLWASMYFDAADTYRPAYRAASYYGARALAATAELERPAIFTATDTDMLFPHMARLPPLKPGQEIRHIGILAAAKHDLIAEGFARFGSPHPAPADRDGLASTLGIARQFVDTAEGAQMHLRYAGDRNNPAVLLLHDAPFASEGLQALTAALSRRHFVLAPDLPGNGESDPFPAAEPTMADFADAAADLVRREGLGPIQVYGVGFGASVAVELARRSPELVAGVMLGGLLAATAEERLTLAEAYTPPIAIERDGAHWYRTWLMLRDSLVWWPWFDRRKATLRRTPEDFDAGRLHRCTLDVMRRHQTYGCLAQAAFRHDAVAALADLKVPAWRLADAPTPLSVYDDRLAELAPGLPVITSGRDEAATAVALSHLFDHVPATRAQSAGALP